MNPFTNLLTRIKPDFFSVMPCICHIWYAAFCIQFSINSSIKLQLCIIFNHLINESTKIVMIFQLILWLVDPYTSGSQCFQSLCWTYVPNFKTCNEVHIQRYSIYSPVLMFVGRFFRICPFCTGRTQNFENLTEQSLEN